MTLKLPFQKCPNASVDHRSFYLKFLLDLAFIGSHVLFASFPSLFQYVDIVGVILLLLTLGVCLSKQFVVPIYNKNINITVNLIHWVILSCCFIIVINSFDESVTSVNMYYLAILIPFMVGMSFLVQYHWENRVMDRIRIGQSKMEVQHQYILYLLQEHIRNLRADKDKMSSSLKFLFGILDDHNSDCLKNSCLCHHAESIVWILNQKRDENQIIIDLSTQDLDFLNSIQVEILYSNNNQVNAPFTFNDYLDKKYVMLREKRETLNSKMINEDLKNIDFIFEDDRIQKDQSEDNIYYKIDSQKLKMAYFANFIRQYFESAITKFPNSYDIKLLYSYFALYFMKNIFLCINILKQVDFQKLSLIEKTNFRLNEALLLMEIQNQFLLQENYHQGFQYDLLGVMNYQKVKYKQQMDQRNLDAESFLNYARLQEKFNATIIQLSKHIMQFWYVLQEPILLVDKVISEGFSVADYIALTYDTFNKMDEASKHKNEKIYHSFAIIHQQLLNDSQSYYLYLSKMKNVISMRKFIKKNYQMNDSYFELGLLLVSARYENFGKILENNQSFQRITGFSTIDLKYSSYEIVMNDLVKLYHSKFVSDYNQNGERIMLDRKVNQFIKKKNGYIIPAQIIVKNHFSNTYGYTFIAFFNEIPELQLDGSTSIGIPTSNLMFMLCDNQDGRIYNVCKNSAKYLGIKKHYLIQNSSYLDFEIRIGQISPYLDINNFKDILRNNENRHDNLFYGIFKLDLNCISQRVQSVFQATNYVNARFKIFFEQFHNKSFEYYVIVIQIIEQDQINQNRLSLGFEDERTQTMGQEDSEINKAMAYEDANQSSNSSTDSSKQTDLIKNQTISMEKKTPRSLKIVIQLLLIMFLTMITVSAVNLYLTQSRQQKIISQIEIANKSSGRLNFAGRCRLMVRELMNIANGLEPTSTKLLSNRSQYYKTQLLMFQEQLRIGQNQLDNYNYLFSDHFQEDVKRENLFVQYLDENGRIYASNHTLNYLMNIYVSKLLEFYNYNMTQLKTKMDIQQLKNASYKFKPTAIDQTIFFVIQNGNDVLNSYIWTTDELYNEEVENYANDTIFQTEITIILSIIIIAIVFLVVTPIISVIQDRQYQAVAFFLLVPKNQIDKLIEQTQKCLEQLIVQDNLQLKSKQGKYIAGDQNADQSSRNEMMSQNIGELQNNNTNNNISFQTMNHTKQENTISDMDILVTHNQNDISLYDANSNVSRQQLKDETQRQMQGRTLLNRLKSRSKQNNDYSSSSQASDEISHENINNDQNQEKQNQDKKVEEDKLNEIEENEGKQQTLLNFKKSKRIKVITISLTFMVCFCVYFLGSFFMTQNTYNRILVIMDQLNTIYNKDICIENAMIFLKESFAQNVSYVLFHQPKTIASNYYIQQCLELEHKYTILRKNQDTAFDDVKRFMIDIETDRLCQVIYPNDSARLKVCQTSYNGILLKGIQNALSIVISNLNQLDLRFNSMKQRTLDEIKVFNNNTELREMVEMKVYIMDEIFNQLKLRSYSSGTQYLDQQTAQYVIFFTAFIATIFVLIIVIFGVVLSKMRNYLWQINLAMKVLPLDDLPKGTINNLKKFFKN
ncbi:UNKNOWN [Stylonychia lemnae]|uniref:Pas domain s-box family protein n=1 Tax=Stylonychia lemnae TaxID=5949 RepID=A0A077ZNY2_STYLE|nr:UNKNOWN [Stylonychia lemnae]|eukprot:CDW71672.1 UNKNOWN [Stylonychia lemnae]